MFSFSNSLFLAGTNFVFSLMISEIAGQEVNMSSASKSCSGLVAGTCCEEQANIFFCFHLSLSIDSRIIFRLQKNRITNPVSGFLFD